MVKAAVWGWMVFFHHLPSARRWAASVSDGPQGWIPSDRCWAASLSDGPGMDLDQKAQCFTDRFQSLLSSEVAGKIEVFEITRKKCVLLCEDGLGS